MRPTLISVSARAPNATNSSSRKSWTNATLKRKSAKIQTNASYLIRTNANHLMIQTNASYLMIQTIATTNRTNQSSARDMLERPSRAAV